MRLAPGDCIRDALGMIRLVPPGTPRRFTQEEIDELRPVLHRMSHRAHERATLRARRYGLLRDTEPEWNVLRSEMRGIIDAWAEQVRRLGAEPHELWTVAFPMESGTSVWAYEVPESPQDDEPQKTHA